MRTARCVWRKYPGGVFEVDGIRWTYLSHSCTRMFRRRTSVSSQKDGSRQCVVAGYSHSMMDGSLQPGTLCALLDATSCQEPCASRLQ